jgi:DNA polymerase-4
VEPISLDEAFLDVRGSERLFGPAEAIGHTIQRRIRDELRLTASVGVASSKFLAKLASDLEKPSGFTVIRDEEREALLAPLPVTRLWGVGPATAKSLADLGVRTVEQLRRLPDELLQQRFGSYAESLSELAYGRAPGRVTPDREAKSISNETTFAVDITDLDHLECVLLGLTEEVAFRVREACLVARTITVKMRVLPFKTITRSRTLPRPTDGTMETYQCAKELMREYLGASQSCEPVRLLGVGTSNLVAQENVQRDLFEPPGRAKAGKVDRAVDAIRKKMGDGSIRRGRLLGGEE